MRKLKVKDMLPGTRFINCRQGNDIWEKVSDAEARNAPNLSGSSNLAGCWAKPIKGNEEGYCYHFAMNPDRIYELVPPETYKEPVELPDDCTWDVL